VNILLNKTLVDSTHWVNNPKIVHVLYPDSHPSSEVVPQQFHHMSNLFPGTAD
jgi:protoporphyrinogen oxidase